MADYSQEMAYVKAYLTDGEIAERIAALHPSHARKELARWSGPTMNPHIMTVWAQLADAAGADELDGDSIYVPKTLEEKTDTVLYNEWSRRKYSVKDMPEDLEDPQAAALEYAVLRDAERTSA
jgi:hypothetical protein